MGVRPDAVRKRIIFVFRVVYGKCRPPTVRRSVQQAREVSAEVLGVQFGAGAGLLDDEPAGLGLRVGEEEEFGARARVAEVRDVAGGEAAAADDAVARGAGPAGLDGER